MASEQAATPDPRRAHGRRADMTRTALPTDPSWPRFRRQGPNTGKRVLAAGNLARKRLNRTRYLVTVSESLSPLGGTTPACALDGNR